MSRTELDSAVREVFLQKLMTAEDLGGRFGLFAADTVFPAQCLKALVDFVDVKRVEEEGFVEAEAEKSSLVEEDAVVNPSSPSEVDGGTMEVLPQKLRAYSGLADAVENVASQAFKDTAIKDRRSKVDDGARVKGHRYEFCASKTASDCSDAAAAEQVPASVSLLENVTSHRIRVKEKCAIEVGAAAMTEDMKPSAELQEEVDHAVRDSAEMTDLGFLIASREAEVEEGEVEGLSDCAGRVEVKSEQFGRASEDVKSSVDLVDKVENCADAAAATTAEAPSESSARARVESKQKNKPLIQNLETDSYVESVRKEHRVDINSEGFALKNASNYDVDSIDTKIALFESLELKFKSKEQHSLCETQSIVPSSKEQAVEISVSSASAGSRNWRRKANQLGRFEEEREDVDEVLAEESEDVVGEAEAEESRQYEFCPAKTSFDDAVGASLAIEEVKPVAEKMEKVDSYCDIEQKIVVVVIVIVAVVVVVDIYI